MPFLNNLVVDVPLISQLDPSESRLLHLKGASLSFLNERLWTVSGAQLGRYLHILSDVADKVARCFW